MTTRLSAVVMATDTIETWPGYREIPPRFNITRDVLDRQIDAGLRDRRAFVFDAGSITYGELARNVGN